MGRTNSIVVLHTETVPEAGCHREKRDYRRDYTGAGRSREKGESRRHITYSPGKKNQACHKAESARLDPEPGKRAFHAVTVPGRKKSTKTVLARE